MTDKYEFIDVDPKTVKEFMVQEFAEDNLEKTGLKSKKYCIGVQYNNEIIGASKGKIFDAALYISEFIIKKRFRKKGAGSKLIENIETYAKKNNCTKIWVDTYGYQAPDFYQQNGFVEKGRIENYRGHHPRIFFEKELDI